MREPDRSWQAIKGQWRKDAESVGEDFTTFSTGLFAAYDALTKQGDSPNLYCLADDERVHAACQVNRLMMSKFPNPILRARFIVISPFYELGIADPAQYAQMMVALFSGIVWLSRDTMTASHIRFFLKSPGDGQFFAALKAATEHSLFSEFNIGGGLIECSLKEAETEDDDMAAAMAEPA